MAALADEFELNGNSQVIEPILDLDEGIFDDKDLLDFVKNIEQQTERDTPLPSESEPVSMDLTMKEQELREFVNENEKVNTRVATNTALNKVTQHLRSLNENRPIEEIPPQQLDILLADFVKSAKKSGRKNSEDTEFEPGTLTSYINSIERYLGRKGYSVSLRDRTFKLLQDTLSSKRRNLTRNGKGNKPNATVALTNAEIDILWTKNVLGDSAPWNLQFTMWFMICQQFGFRARDEHRKLEWGDIGEILF
ncbi:unnamed protein product [Owenia fusiformis]|uniref:Uncharacterized protein n=1 Tax=Owenia fusiformis TaxID=6347 RepID=A0A8S4PFQ0_OWEFU|nr:unnamed protein product [Owenia fusiformis]